MTYKHWLTNPLKHCPFCGSKAYRTGGTLGDITIATCRCSNDDCIASFKSVEHDVWNTRAIKSIADKTTKGDIVFEPYAVVRRVEE